MKKDSFDYPKFSWYAVVMIAFGMIGAVAGMLAPNYMAILGGGVTALAGLLEWVFNCVMYLCGRVSELEEDVRRLTQDTQASEVLMTSHEFLRSKVGDNVSVLLRKNTREWLKLDGTRTFGGRREAYNARAVRRFMKKPPYAVDTRELLVVVPLAALTEDEANTEFLR